MPVFLNRKYVGPDLDREFFDNVLPRLDKLGPILNQVIWAEAFGGSYVAGNCKDIPALFIGHSSGDERAAAFRRFDHHDPERKTAQHPVPERKILRQGR